MAAIFSATPFLSDVIEVPLKAGYSWSVKSVGQDAFYSEFHGEKTAADTTTTVAHYHKMTGTADKGTLSAPFDGIHGWFFQNSGVKPVTVRLRLAGFYPLIRDGPPGNEVGLHAKEVQR